MKHLMNNLYCDEDNFYGAINYLRQHHEKWSEKARSRDESEKAFVELIAHAIGDPIDDNIKTKSGSGQLEIVYKGIFMTIDDIIPPQSSEEISIIRFYQVCR
ncbi:MAG: hypothetical protein PHX24_02215 [Acidithiobacillus sp.]|nr:hypothetical protein [Acidithiobacillus sp.]